MPALYARLVRPVAVFVGGRPWLPRFNRRIVALDRLLQKATRGRVGLVDLAGLHGLTLTVAGARSGIPRRTPLLCVPHADGWLVAGSNWGAPQPPAWVGNVAAADRASVNYRGTEWSVVPREVTGAERDQVWAVMTHAWPNYAKYEARTDRPIRVFHLRRLEF